MTTIQADAGALSEAAIWARRIRSVRRDLSAAARAILRIGFDDADKARMHELAEKGQGDGLSEAEQAEVEAYRRVGRILDLMHSKARRSLDSTGRSRPHA